MQNKREENPRERKWCGQNPWGRGGMVAGGFDTDDGSLVTRLRKMGRFQKTRGDRVSVINLNFREKQASLLLEHLNIFF